MRSGSPRSPPTATLFPYTTLFRSRGVGKSIASHRHRTGIATFQLSPSGLIRGPRAGDGTVALDARVKPEHDDSADDGKPDGGSAISALLSPPSMLSLHSTAGSPPI